MPTDPSVDIRTATYQELADELEDGAVGIAIDTNFIMFTRRAQAHNLQALTDGLRQTPPLVKNAAYACVPGDVVILTAGGLPTLPLLLEAQSAVDPLATPAPAWPGCVVQISNTTGAAINVATGAGATINGAGVGVAYSLLAATNHTFQLDATGTNWVVL